MFLFLFLFLFLLSSCKCIHYHKKTIIIDEKDIIPITKTIISKDPRAGLSYDKYYQLRGSSSNLNGFYKVIIDKDTFYTLHFENGTKNIEQNIIKYYYKNKIYKVDIYLSTYLINKYYSIEDFSCKNKSVKFYIKNVFSENVIESFNAEQKIEGKYIMWYFDGKTRGFSKKALCNCE